MTWGTGDYPILSPILHHALDGCKRLFCSKHDHDIDNHQGFFRCTICGAAWDCSGCWKTTHKVEETP